MLYMYCYKMILEKIYLRPRKKNNCQCDNAEHFKSCLPSFSFVGAVAFWTVCPCFNGGSLSCFCCSGEYVDTASEPARKQWMVSFFQHNFPIIMIRMFFETILSFSTVSSLPITPYMIFAEK